MNPEPVYLVDSDVFITAKNRYYAFDICPGFWDSLIHGYHAGRLHSITQVRQELSNWSEEELTRWLQVDLPHDFFLESSEPDVTAAFRAIMQWVYQKDQYFDNAKADFATKADGWLVAYAMVHGHIVATNELSSPNSKREVKLGDVCLAFDVDYQDTFEMLRSVQARFGLAGAS